MVEVGEGAMIAKTAAPVVASLFRETVGSGSTVLSVVVHIGSFYFSIPAFFLH